MSGNRLDTARTDTAIIGAGAAGLMAAVQSARSGSATLLLEQNDRPGAKLLITGGGRCNILPVRADPEVFVTSSSRNSLARITRGWSAEAAARFFTEEAGTSLEPEEGTGKIFAFPDGAAGVVRALVRLAGESGAGIRYRSRILDLEPSAGGWTLRMEGGCSVIAKRVVVATGGRSWPGTGSGGWGFRVAEKLGHTVRTVYPALVPLRSSDTGFSSLAGIVVQVAISSVFEGRPFVSTGPLLFTHRGFSGPAVMNASHAVTGARGVPAVLSVSWGGFGEDEWESVLLGGKGRIAGVLEKKIPSRLAAALMKAAGLEGASSFAELDRGRRLALRSVLSRMPLPVTGDCGWDEAEVTGGGVALEEVRPDTLESRLHPGLHFAGEVLDVFGPVGGYNLYWAWLTGFAAGRAGGAPSRIRTRARD